ncbi:MAG: hypothetical protein ABS98_03970 [Lysobacteraceae bacterium SCN 69-48]|nr:MAG: hypothetical protein ABS98_03970 [Xanthomonadaceae bacterium SCN 69-48]
MTHFGAPFLFILTAIAEIVGCYLPLLWLRGQAKIWVLLPAAGALVAFVWLLTLHPNEAGRTYAAYGCVYVAVALAWLWVVEGIKPTRWDALGVGLAIAGMLVIVYAPRGTAP